MYSYDINAATLANKCVCVLQAECISRFARETCFGDRPYSVSDSTGMLFFLVAFLVLLFCEGLSDTFFRNNVFCPVPHVMKRLWFLERLRRFLRSDSKSLDLETRKGTEIPEWVMKFLIKWSFRAASAPLAFPQNRDKHFLLPLTP